MLRYHYLNFDSYFGCSKKQLEEIHPSMVIATSARDILEECLQASAGKDVCSDGRITIINNVQY